MKNEKKLGAILSYTNIILNMCISVFFTPFLIRSLGDAEYGLYRVIQSFAGQFVIMTLGMSTIVSRNIVYYNETNKKEEKENFLAMAMIISGILVAILLGIGIIVYFNINNIFSNSLSSAEIETAKTLFIIFLCNIAVTIINDLFSGILNGHERFAVNNGTKTLNRILRIVILVVLIKLGFKSIAIVATDLALMVLVLVFNMFFGLSHLNEKIKFHYIDKQMLRATLLFSGAMLLQAVVNQVNNNMDNFILGIMTDTKTVTLYSVALTVFNAYACLTTVIVSIFSPQATRMVVNNATSDDLTNLVSRTGRYQFIIAGLVVVGFILFGRNFISIWVGNSYLPAYEITLILIIPITIPLIESVSNSVLDAKLKRMGRSIILCVMALINIVLSVILIKIFGYIGAAYGTALSVIIGHCILLNIYLKKTIGLKVFRMFKDIFKGLLPSIVVSTIICVPLAVFLPNTFIMFVVKVLIFMFVFLAIVYKFGMNAEEKNMIRNIIKRKKG